jgi:hypothetical protein
MKSGTSDAKLLVFLKAFQAKALQLNWTGLLSYVYQGPPEVRKNLITHYEEITREEIRQKD